MRKSLVEKRFFTSFRMTMSCFYRDCPSLPVASIRASVRLLSVKSYFGELEIYFQDLLNPHFTLYAVSR